ncbi:hypothetical protein [Aeromonas enteropelogenes]|uniref:hypothetical protein n=1 Tax=Aeromonas enteropelogenes TaxID=29489 RepID=UPI003BA0D773
MKKILLTRPEYRASDAIRDTEKAREENLEEAAVPFIETAFEKIKLAAESGKGSVHKVFDDCPMSIQIVGMKYLAICGYKTQTDGSGGVVKWIDDEIDNKEVL